MKNIITVFKIFAVLGFAYKQKAQCVQFILHCLIKAITSLIKL